MKKVFREIHARSLWQVLGIYLAGSWVVLQVVDQLTQSAGLPAWVPSFALVLLLIGFPIVIATAFLQHRAPAPERTPEAASGDATGIADATAMEASRRAAIPASDAPSPPSGAPRRLFTWRNALLGGVGAALLFGVVLGGWTYARSRGIGAAGTLVAKGVIKDGERVILSDFSGDSAMAEVATMAFRVDLSQSPTIALADPTFLSSVLQRMEVDPTTRLDAKLAREAAIREGIKAVVAGEVVRAGGSYVVTARLVAAETGTDLINLRETAADSTKVMESVDQLSRKMRERLGESLGSIRASAPLDRATTTSLEALRKYSQALEAIDAGDHDLGKGLLREAVDLDPKFAMAWRKLAVEEFDDPTARKEAATRAYELRDLLTDRERYLTIGTYHGYVTLDRDASITAYRALLDQYPNDAWALNNLAIEYQQSGERELANGLLTRAIEQDPYTPNAYINLAGGLQFWGDADSARSVMDGLERTMPGSPYPAEWRIRFALTEWDYDTARRLADSLSRTENTEFRRRALFLQSVADLAEGELHRAERRWLDSRSEPSPADVAGWEAWNDLVVIGDPKRATRTLDAALGALATLDTADVGTGLAFIYALAGRTADGRRWLAADRRADNEHASSPAPVRAGNDAWFESAIAYGEGRFDDAVRDLRDAEREYDSFTDGLGARLVSWDLARAFDAAGQADSAIARYELALDLTRDPRETAGQARVAGRTYERLGQLYDERGDLERAAGYYGRFVELWKDADPELQPRVREARARLDEIAKERG